jgi:hypothetical protein
MLTAFCAGCGYRAARHDNPLLDGIETIAIPYFKNKTYEQEAEALFTHAFVDEFVESRTLMVTGREQADVILFGTVEELNEEPISYSADEDKALEYRVRVTLELSLENMRTGEVLWKRDRMEHGEEYAVGTAIVMTEAGKRVALKRLARDLAERAHDSIMQGF